LLAEPLREITHHAWEAAEHETDRQHPHTHHAVLQLAHVAFELREPSTQAVAHRALNLGP
jgi:hypothetical protein